LTNEIEVAFFKSIFSDVADTDEGERKGNTPKEETICKSPLGHAVKNCMTVIREGGALSKDKL
jgi:hypothetical protein